MEKNFSIVKPEYEKIYNSVQKLSFSEDSILDLMNFIDEAISIATKQESNRGINICLNNLLQTKEKQQKDLIRKNLNLEERKKYFQWAKEHFIADLTGSCR